VPPQKKKKKKKRKKEMNMILLSPFWQNTGAGSTFPA
jgi:hypothetical protein